VKIQTTAAQVWWISLPDEIRPVDGLDVAATFAAIKDTFGFMNVTLSQPPTQQQPQPTGGSEFANGALQTTSERIIISKLTVFSDGVSIDVPSNTDNAETVLQAVLGIFYSFGIREPVTPPLHYYHGTIVADLDHSLDNLIPASLLKMVQAATPVGGVSQFSSIGINADKTTIRGRIGPINPSAFNIARRVDVPYETNRYFSTANMRTTDHLAIIKEFERLAGKAK
jgi:hypothetical protein